MNNNENSTKVDVVDETLQIFDKYSSKRDVWAQHAKEDKEFRLGKQWTSEQKRVLESRGQAAIVINRVHPAVESAKALLTSNRPAFRCAAREDSDNKIAGIMSNMLAYMYDISDGTAAIRQMVDDYYVMGVGYIHCYQDPSKDMGKGEVCFHDVDPLDVYVDPNSRSRFLDDAENVIVSKLFTKSQAQKLWPMYKDKIENATTKGAFGKAGDWNAPSTSREDEGQVQFPEDVGRVNDQDYIRGYERYSKIDVKEYRIFEKFTGKEKLLDEDKFKEYLEEAAFIIKEQIIKNAEKAAALLSQLSMQAKQMHDREVLSMENAGYAHSDIEKVKEKGPEQVPYEQVTNKDLAERGQIEIVAVTMSRIKQCVIVGDALLYSRILPLQHYPIIPAMNIHTRTPYPVSDVRLIKPLQEYINKTRSLIIAHATTSTNTKILVPEGSVDMKDFEERWAQPGVALPYDPTDGAPMPVQPTPLPNELYQNEQTAKNDIDHALGVYEMMQGNSAAAPQTYKATIALDEFGQRKMKSKLADIEGALVRLGQVAIPLMQQLYTSEKIFRVIQPNNSLSEYVVNQKLVDDKTGEIEIFNDITVGKYDIIVVSGSTLPSNRYAELEFYMDAFQKGLIDRKEVLKKTEVFDMEGVLERTDEIGKLQQQVQGQEEEIKKLKGDLQSRDRESVNLRKRVEVEKFKNELDQVSNKAKAAGTVYERRLDDSLSTVKSKIKDSTSKLGSPSTGGKRGSKKEKK
tara:strand:- start:1886 stop:4111 length:2226 start_codon:yes stop_codon:yes gene_type:complete